MLGRVLVVLKKFMTYWIRRNKRAFERMKEDVNKIRARWYQTLGLMATGDSLYSIENLSNLIDCVIDT